MDEHVKRLSILIHKRFNKKILLKTYSITSSVSENINIEYLANRIRQRSYKAFLIFNTIELTPAKLSLIFVLVNINGKINIPTRKIALGFVTNINIYKEVVPYHIYNLLEIIHYNAQLYLKSDMGDVYRQRAVSLSDDVLSFYIGMYDIYMTLRLVKKIPNIIKEEISVQKTIPEHHIKILKQIFFLERCDFLENLFYNFKEIKKMTKMTYTYVLHETVKSTFNRKIDELEIILTEKGFLLYYNIPEKEYILKLSKIFKFFFKIKKLEYLCRKLGFYKLIRFINKFYFYACEIVINKKDIFKDIDSIITEIYLEESIFYNFIKEMDTKLMNCMINKRKIDDEFIKKNMNELLVKTENDIFQYN